MYTVLWHEIQKKQISFNFFNLLNGPGDGVQSQVASYQRLKKWYLISPCLTLSIIRYASRVKWSNPGRAVAPSLTSRCSSYWKGTLLVALDYGRQLISNISNLLNSESWPINCRINVNKRQKLALTSWVLVIIDESISFFFLLFFYFLIFLRKKFGIVPFSWKS